MNAVIATMSLAELKRRLTVGTELMVVHNYKGDVRAKRTVAGVQTNAVSMICEETPTVSWLHWRKGQKVEVTDRGFRLPNPTGNGRYVEYEWAEA